jgi:hypothetical protein
VLWTTTPKPKELIRKLSAPQPGRVDRARLDVRQQGETCPTASSSSWSSTRARRLAAKSSTARLIDPEESGIMPPQLDEAVARPTSRCRALTYIVLSLDTAFTEATYDRKQRRSRTARPASVMGAFSTTERDKTRTTNLLLLDCWVGADGHARPDPPGEEGDSTWPTATIDDTALIKPMFGGVEARSRLAASPTSCLIEDKGSGISLAPDAGARGHRGLRLQPRRRADKLARLHMVSHVFARGRVSAAGERQAARPAAHLGRAAAGAACAFTGTGSIKHDDSRGRHDAVRPPRIGQGPRVAW